MWRDDACDMPQHCKILRTWYVHAPSRAPPQATQWGPQSTCEWCKREDATFPCRVRLDSADYNDGYGKLKDKRRNESATVLWLCNYSQISILFSRLRWVQARRTTRWALTGAGWRRRRSTPSTAPGSPPSTTARTGGKYLQWHARLVIALVKW